jgi:hypothetical protein
MMIAINSGGRANTRSKDQQIMRGKRNAEVKQGRRKGSDGRTTANKRIKESAKRSTGVDDSSVKQLARKGKGCEKITQLKRKLSDEKSPGRNGSVNESGVVDILLDIGKGGNRICAPVTDVKMGREGGENGDSNTDTDEGEEEEDEEEESLSEMDSSHIKKKFIWRSNRILP